jgi:hypothetical protein
MRRARSTGDSSVCILGTSGTGSPTSRGGRRTVRCDDCGAGGWKSLARSHVLGNGIRDSSSSQCALRVPTGPTVESVPGDVGYLIAGDDHGGKRTRARPWKRGAPAGKWKESRAKKRDGRYSAIHTAPIMGHRRLGLRAAAGVLPAFPSSCRTAPARVRLRRPTCETSRPHRVARTRPTDWDPD